jgi:hypothetical protein
VTEETDGDPVLRLALDPLDRRAPQRGLHLLGGLGVGAEDCNEGSKSVGLAMDGLDAFGVGENVRPEHSLDLRCWRREFYRDDLFAAELVPLGARQSGPECPSLKCDCVSDCPLGRKDYRVSREQPDKRVENAPPPTLLGALGGGQVGRSRQVGHTQADENLVEVDRGRRLLMRLVRECP